MRVEWLPFSASALVAGGVSLAASSLLMPSTDGNSADSLESVLSQSSRWLAVSVLFFVAAVLLTLGLPSVLTLVTKRTARMGLFGLGVFAVGCIGTAGYAMLLVFFHALVKTDSLRAGNLDTVVQDNGLASFLYGWIAAFYVGELLLAITLLRARTVPRWIPLLLVLHVLTLPLNSVLPDKVGSATILLVTVALAGIGITANQRGVVSPA